MNDINLYILLFEYFKSIIYTKFKCNVKLIGYVLHLHHIVI